MQPQFQSVKMRTSSALLKRYLQAVFLCAFCTLGNAHVAMSEDIPLPTKKPALTESVQVDEQMGPVQQPQALEEESDRPGFSFLDFTAALLDFSGPPLPPRKPAYIPPKPTTIDKLLSKFESFDPAGTIAKDQAELYKLVFSAQDSGDMDAADAILKDIKDPRLMGHVLYQRYMHPKYKSSYKELKQWLKHFNDHPGADKIHKLALLRKPEGTSTSALNKPEQSRGVTRTHEPTMRVSKRYVSSRKRTDEQIRALNTLNREIYSLVRKGEPEKAKDKLNANKASLDPVEYDVLRGEVAAGYLYQGNVDHALELSAQSVKNAGLHVPKAGWVAGLVSWSRQDYTAAARYFEVVARSPYASGWTASAGSYWAARSHMRMGNVKAVSIWLKRGMRQPRTFYGLISTRALGRNFDFNWKVQPFTKDYMDVLSHMPAGNRAMALVVAQQPHLAEAELIRIQPKSDEEYKGLLAYAGYANLPGLALRLATAASAAKGDFYDAALYPTGPWKFEQDYRIDPALVHAIMRQESRFDPRAKSPSGARGLMQLMPATAKSVAGSAEAKLDHPETNLELGRKYLEDLLDSSTVEGDLLYLLIAYNAGPGNLSKWKKRWGHIKDPLMFIELIPSSETRAYVERVLSNYWIYRLREGADTPTLDSLAAGRAALYASESL